MNKIKNIDTIVFGGASAYGYSYFGVYDKLLELGFNFKRVAGVSAGSIFSLAISLFPSIEDKERRKKILEFFDARNIVKKELNCWGKLKLVYNILTNGGGLKGIGLKEEIENFLEHFGYSKNITFEDLYKYTGMELDVYSFEGTEYKFYKFNRNNTPNVKVVDACFISSLIPIIFESKRLKVNNKELVFMDGAVYNWSPLDQYDKEKSIGITILPLLGSVSGASVIEKIAIIPDILFDRLQELLLRKYYSEGRMFYLVNLKYMFDISSVDFEKINIETRNRLYDRGYIDFSLDKIINF